MFQTINGVQVRERRETKDKPNIIDKRFEVEYLDNVYLNRLVCIDIINIPVHGNERKFVFKRLKSHGRMWIYVIKHKDFHEIRKKYGEVCSLIHDKIGLYLQENYGLSFMGPIIIDGMDRVYITDK